MPLSPGESSVYEPQKPNIVLPRRAFLLAGAELFIAAGRLRFGCASALANDAPKEEEFGEDALHMLIDQEWNKQNAVYRRIADVGMQRFYDELPEKGKVFLSETEIKEAGGICACCSDEGIRKYSAQKSDKRMMLIRTPGSGILQVLAQKNKDPFASAFIDATAREQLELGVTVFTSHIGCGAAEAAFNANILSLRSEGKADQADRLEKKGSDAWARDWADAVSKRMRTMAKEQSIKHGDSIHSDYIDHLDRPLPFHIARDFYLVDDDRFNADSDLPPGFVEHAGTSNVEQGIADITALSDIAFSDHGFGRKFSKAPEQQFILCAVTRTQQRLNVLMARAQKAHRKFRPDLRGKVRVEGILAS